MSELFRKFLNEVLEIYVKNIPEEEREKLIKPYEEEIYNKYGEVLEECLKDREKNKIPFSVIRTYCYEIGNLSLDEKKERYSIQ